MLFAGDFRFLLIGETILNYRSYVSPRHPFALYDLILSMVWMQFSIKMLMLKPVTLVAIAKKEGQWL